MKPKYTPGPWEQGTNHEKEVFGKDFVIVADCDVSWSHSETEKEANALLISFAPEMLEQLKYVVEIFGHDEQCQCESCRYLKPVIDIIKKAEGRE